MLSINIEGRKDVLGMWVGKNESSKFWLSGLNEIKNRNTKGILIIYVNGLTGFDKAIEAVFPRF